MAEVVAVRHVFAPRASVGGHRIGDNQLGQASVRTVGVHLLNDENLDDACLGGVIDLGPVNPVEATACGIPCGRSLTGGGGGLKGSLLRSLECGLRIGEGSSQLGLTCRILGGSRRVACGRGCVARQERIVFSSDATFCPDRALQKASLVVAFPSARVGITTREAAIVVAARTTDVCVRVSWNDIDYRPNTMEQEQVNLSMRFRIFQGYFGKSLQVNPTIFKAFSV